MTYDTKNVKKMLLNNILFSGNDKFKICYFSDGKRFVI